MKKKQIIIGIWFLIALAILYVGMNYLKGLNVWSRDKDYFVRFDDVSGVGVASSVFINGYKVGNVQELDFDYTGDQHTIARIRVSPKVQIPLGATVRLESPIIGGVTVHLDYPTHPTGVFLAPGDTLQAQPQGKDMMKSVQEDLLPKAQSLITRLDSAAEGINQLLRDPQVQQILSQVNGATEHLSSMSGKLDQASGKIAPLLAQVDPIMREFRTLSARLNTLSGSIDSAQLSSIVTSLDGSVQNLHAFSEQLNSADGTIGQLLHNQGLYHRIDSLVATAETLIADIKANPKKYISVSVF